MPTYTYRCKECGHQFDQRQRMSDDPLTICPVCEGEIRRVVSSVGVVFKGSGFYVTDNRGKNSANGKNPETTSNTENPSEKKTATPAADAKKTSKASAGAAA
jgi:putative FmdB family regulatory protein